MLPIYKVGYTLSKNLGGEAGCLRTELCCRVSSNHQLLSKLGMEWVPLLSLFSLLLPKLAEY